MRTLEDQEKEQLAIKAFLAITEEDIVKMDYKTKQKYYAQKSKLRRVIYSGRTPLIKNKEVKK